tara:strand:- start:1424 stop:2005 length:582 start_codon:yes stop_codon:yes gene_type:complete
MILEAVVVAGALATGMFLERWRQSRRVKPLQPGAAELDLRFCAHPEHALDQLDRDLSLLADGDRLEVSATIKLRVGWTDAKARTIDLGPFFGSPEDVFNGICSTILDDNSPLTRWGGSESRQMKKTHPNLHNWRQKSNSKVFWLDSDSPVELRIYGTVRSPEPVKTLTEDERAAIHEVDTFSKHAAAIRRQHQ